MAKEENAIILDYLPNGYPLDTRPSHRKTAIAQAIGKQHFILLELVPKKGIGLQPNEEVYLGEGKRDKIHHILGRIFLDKLTQTARAELEIILDKLIDEYEKRFVEFFSSCGPINARRHYLELIPGIGKKHMWEIIESRKEKPFESFDDIRKRVKLLPDPKQAVIKRILMEINNEDKHKIFTG
jgi:putative nucleotide binding protein|tara:strand:- start:292 stop:840 length:549 start_codon:yes stop_codon:yes gene_type:complete